MRPPPRSTLFPYTTLFRSGLSNISATINEEKDSIEEIIEPYLIQIGFLNRTPRGRMATRLAYEHFGIPIDRKSTRLNSSHANISYAVFCLKKKNTNDSRTS